jgi:hypothetical protein
MYLSAKRNKTVVCCISFKCVFSLNKKGEQKEIIALISEEAFDQVKKRHLR